MGGNTGGNRTARFCARVRRPFVPTPRHGHQTLREPHRSPRRPIAGRRLRARRSATATSSPTRRAGASATPTACSASARSPSRRATPARSTARAPPRSPSATGRSRSSAPATPCCAPTGPPGSPLGDLFKEWIAHHAAPNTGERYAQRLGAHLGQAHRAAARPSEARRARDDPGIIVRFHEDLQQASLAISARRASLALLRAVLRWGRRRYPRALIVDVSGLFQVPSAKRRRLIRAADPIAVERIIEAVLDRPHRDPLGPVRDAALVAAMGFTVAARPSEWLVSATWARRARELRRASGRPERAGRGVRRRGRAQDRRPRGAAAAQRLRPPDRLPRALEARFGPQPGHALVFQVLSKDGPLWYEDGFPVEWSEDHYKRWTARVWRPARQVAAQGARHGGLDRRPRRSTSCATPRSRRRCTRRSSMTKDGMNLHTLAVLRRPRRPDDAALLRARDRPLPRPQADRPRGGVQGRAAAGV